MGLLTDLAQRFENGVDTLRRIIETPDRMDAADERMDALSLNQQYLTEVADGINQAEAAISARLDALEAESDLDFTDVRAAVAHLGALGQSVPDPETPLPTPPTTDPSDPSVPVDTTPVDPAPVGTDPSFPADPLDPADDGSAQQL